MKSSWSLNLNSCKQFCKCLFFVVQNGYTSCGCRIALEKYYRASRSSFDTANGAAFLRKTIHPSRSLLFNVECVRLCYYKSVLCIFPFIKFMEIWGAVSQCNFSKQVLSKLLSKSLISTNTCYSHVGFSYLIFVGAHLQIMEVSYLQLALFPRRKTYETL